VPTVNSALTKGGEIMSEHINTDRISQVVKTLYEQTGMSVFIDCKVHFYQSSKKSDVSWQLSFISPDDKDCKIRDFNTYQEILDWIANNIDLISGKKHPLFF
jgi:hypothetical protein